MPQFPSRAAVGGAFLLILLSGSVGSIGAFTCCSDVGGSSTGRSSRRSGARMMTTDNNNNNNNNAADANILPSSNEELASSAAAFGRRQALFRTASVSAALGWGVVVSSAVLPGVAVAMAAEDDDGVGTCPRGSQNCIRTTWTPPPNTSPAQASQVVKQVLEAYPQEGYDKVDLGGWKVVDDQFSSSAGKVSRVEFTSGIGNFAKFLNGGRPFVDDVWIRVDPESSVVEVRSSSRVGDSDLGVNKKRLAFFAKALSERGWTVPEPAY
jgi:Protein of unknown function (DUF1499)